MREQAGQIFNQPLYQVVCCCEESVPYCTVLYGNDWWFRNVDPKLTCYICSAFLRRYRSSMQSGLHVSECSRRSGPGLLLVKLLLVLTYCPSSAYRMLGFRRLSYSICPSANELVCEASYLPTVSYRAFHRTCWILLLKTWWVNPAHGNFDPSRMFFSSASFAEPRQTRQDVVFSFEVCSRPQLLRTGLGIQLGHTSFLWSTSWISRLRLF